MADFPTDTIPDSSTTDATTVEAVKPAATSGIAAKAKETVQAVSDEVRSLSSQAAGQAREAAKRGKETAVEKAAAIPRLLEEGAATVDRELGEGYGKYVRSAAAKTDQLIKAVEQKDVDELIDDVRGFIRKSPALAIGAAAAAGFLLARLVKSGHEEP